MIEALLQKAEEAGCYKVFLDCSENMVPFYTKCGLLRKDVQMIRYYDGSWPPPEMPKPHHDTTHGMSADMFL